MRKVKIYTLHCDEAMVSSRREFYEVYKFERPSTCHIRNSDEIVAMTETIINESWPIEQWNGFNKEPLYISCDPEIRKILHIDKEEQERLNRVNKKLLEKNQALQFHLEDSQQALNMYVNMSFWERFKFLFKDNNGK